VTQLNAGKKNTLVKALTAKNRKLNFSDVEPTAMLGSVMKFDTFKNSFRLSGFKSLVERRRSM
jgi:hypothetical protein